MDSAIELRMQKMMDAKKRAACVKKWPPRLVRLRHGKRKPITVRDWCAKYGLDHYQLSHYLGGRRLPSWDSIRKIEAAMKSAGV